VNLAVRGTPKPHVTIKYLEPDFTGLFLNGLRGLAPDGGLDSGYRGRELARNAALVFYLSKADPLLVLRDLLGHSSVLTTEKYLKRLDTTRIYRDAYGAARLCQPPLHYLTNTNFDYNG
jgi:hypothetical protein